MVPSACSSVTRDPACLNVLADSSAANRWVCCWVRSASQAFRVVAATPLMVIFEPEVV